MNLGYFALPTDSSPDWSWSFRFVVRIVTGSAFP